MNDLHATPSFKALDEGRLQPVDNDTDTGALLPVTPLPDPLRMPWEDLRDALWERFKDDERDDDELCVSRAEACSLLGWASHFDREAQPRRDDEEKSFAIIQKAAELLRPADGEVIFSLRISGDHSSLQTSAGKGVEPHTVLSKAIETLEAERKDAAGCPAHRHQSETGAALTRDGREALEKLIVAVEFEVPPIRDGVDVDHRLDVLALSAREARQALKVSDNAQ